MLRSTSVRYTGASHEEALAAPARNRPAKNISYIFVCIAANIIAPEARAPMFVTSIT